MKMLKLIAAIVACFMMVGCGGSDDASKVASKIQNGEQLTEKDYTVMVDYCGKYAEEAQKLQDQINILTPTSEQAGKLTDKIAALTDKYSYVNEFFGKISTSTPEEVGTANADKINRLAPLTWFSAPDWADVTSDSDVVGDIVEMPAEDTAGVIAAGDGEEVK